MRLREGKNNETGRGVIVHLGTLQHFLKRFITIPCITEYEFNYYTNEMEDKFELSGI